LEVENNFFDECEGMLDVMQGSPRVITELSVSIGNRQQAKVPEGRSCAWNIGVLGTGFRIPTEIRRCSLKKKLLFKSMELVDSI